MLNIGIALMCLSVPLKQDPDRASDWVRDLDQDGIVDALDWDKDGDGVANLLDQKPESKTEGGEDSDGDGIPDLADWDREFPTRSSAMCALQSEIFRATRVVLMDSQAIRITEEFACEVQKQLLAAKGFGVTGDQLRVISVTPDFKVGAGHLGWYDRHQRVLKIKADPLQDPSITRHVLLHELAHAIAEARPSLVQEFMRRARWRKEDTLLGAQWLYTDSRGEVFDFLESDALTAPEYVALNVRGAEFVSDHAKLGGDEMFAESVAAVLHGEIHSAREQMFFETALGKWLVQVLGQRNGLSSDPTCASRRCLWR